MQEALSFILPQLSGKTWALMARFAAKVWMQTIGCWALVLDQSPWLAKLLRVPQFKIARAPNQDL
jgi:hypothetical protein